MDRMRRRAAEFLVLAIDIGSSSTRSALFDDKARMVNGTDARREYAVEYSADGGAELSPFRLRQAARNCVRETLQAHRASGFRKVPVIGVSGSAFWHSLLGLDGNGRPLTPIFTWADSRCARDAIQLREQFDERKIHAQTGCMLRASFWPAKLCWFRRTNGNLFRKVVRWVSPADWIFEEIFGTGASSPSMASGTGLYDLRTKKWHEDLRQACEVGIEKLTVITETPRRAISFPGLREAQVFTAVGDGAAGNLGCGANGGGRIAINLGTSAAVRIMEGPRTARIPIPFGLFRYAVDGERTVMGGAISNAGNLRRWCARELRLDENEENSLGRKAAAGDRLIVLPFWIAERAPTWPEKLRGTIVGLTQSTDSAAIFRATTTAVFYRLAEILALIEKTRGRATEIIVSGGAVHSAATLALLADALGRDLCVSRDAEASLRGAARYVLEKLGSQSGPGRKPRRVRHDRRLAEKHRVRRARQAALESMFSKNGAAFESLSG
ncbi:MAG: carbohydrate kinase [Verrucomicrobia bacterium]|nr:MAG: carbohydrate kinase [Verrucomicrobiota bacterium]